MELRSPIHRWVIMGAAATTIAACGGTQSTASTSSTPTVSPTPAPVVITKSDSTHGTFLVAASSQMTLYTFTKDTAGSATSACKVGGCLTSWPALTVAAGTTPTGGTGVTGTLATITRADDGTIQVTYNGLPLYFFHNDKAPGDTNGSYTNWMLAKP
jgi:predicted lipoprotein with Yx(FWY)xxD motif